MRGEIHHDIKKKKKLAKARKLLTAPKIAGDDEDDKEGEEEEGEKGPTNEGDDEAAIEEDEEQAGVDDGMEEGLGDAASHTPVGHDLDVEMDGYGAAGAEGEQGNDADMGVHAANNALVMEPDEGPEGKSKASELEAVYVSKKASFYIFCASSSLLTASSRMLRHRQEPPNMWLNQRTVRSSLVLSSLLSHILNEKRRMFPNRR